MENRGCQVVAFIHRCCSWSSQLWVQFDGGGGKDCGIDVVGYGALKGDNLCEEYVATQVLLGSQIAARGTVT